MLRIFLNQYIFCQSAYWLLTTDTPLWKTESSSRVDQEILQNKMSTHLHDENTLLSI